MSFWAGYASSTASRRFEVVPRPSPSLPGASEFRLAKVEEVPEIQEFLEAFFGQAPKTPIFRPLLNLSDEEEVMLLRKAGVLRATIRSKKSGIFEGQPIYIIDCFCIHPESRRTGIGSRILSALHDHTGSKAMLFLKEGRPVPGVQPLYSSSYVYRAVAPRATGVVPVSPERASRLVQTYRTIYPDTFWLHSTTNPNQHWRLWKKGLQWALACFQDAYQIHPKGGHMGEHIGWMTALFCSNTIGQHALEDLVDAAPFDWIWTDRVWIEPGTKWMEDGPFHWYIYRWTTSLSPRAGGATGNARPCYGIIV